jgi:hypothetical protein
MMERTGTRQQHAEGTDTARKERADRAEAGERANDAEGRGERRCGTEVVVVVDGSIAPSFCVARNHQQRLSLRICGLIPLLATYKI